jgi:hypothetical protein
MVPHVLMSYVGLLVSRNATSCELHQGLYGVPSCEVLEIHDLRVGLIRA